MPTDIVVYVALGEEFEYLYSDLSAYLQNEGGLKPKWNEAPKIAMSWCSVTIKSPSSTPSLLEVAFIPAGAMGNTRASSMVGAIIDHLAPRNLVALGIAGSLSSDLLPGDVFVPKGVGEYLANAAAEGSQETEFVVAGDSHSTDQRLLNRFQAFQWQDSFTTWRAHAKERSAALVGDELRRQLETWLSLRDNRLIVGDDRMLASGPAVCKGEAFAKWLKTKVNRKFAAIEMETAGVYGAAMNRTPPPRVIAIRGISDLADERKQRLEKQAETAFRRLAMGNALALLLGAIRAGLFTENADGGLFPAADTARGEAAFRAGEGRSGKQYVAWEKEERKVSQLLDDGQPAVVFAPPRSGKTYFYRAVLQSLEKTHRIVELSPRMMPQVEGPDQFLRWVGSVTIRSCGGQPAWLDLAWQSRDYENERFEDLLGKYVLPDAELPVLFAIDDAERFFYHKSHPLLFQKFRHFNLRAKPPWERFRVFATTGHTLRRLKMAYGDGSFFAHSRILRLERFTENQLTQLARNHGLELRTDELAQLQHVLGGHPELTGRLLSESKLSGISISAALLRASELFHQDLKETRRALGSGAARVLAQLLAQPGLQIDDEVSDELDGLGLVWLRGREHFLRASLYERFGELL